MKHFNMKNIAAALMVVAVSLLGALPTNVFAAQRVTSVQAGDDGGDKGYIISYSTPVVTDAAQLFSNAEASPEKEPTNLGHLIDEDDQTIFHSRYDSETPIDDYHYIRVYAENGLPDRFVIRYQRRNNSSYGNNAACRPTKVMIAVSKDGENWENEQTLTTVDGLPTVYEDMWYLSKAPISGAGYKYFIFKVLEVNNNFGMSDGYGHPFFTMSEFNLFPVVDLGQESLADYVSNMKYLPTDFRVGNDPGCLGNEMVAAEFEEAYYLALQYMEEEHTAAENEAIKKRLSAALEAAEQNIVGIDESKYYYITTGYDAFTNNSREMYGWCLPYNNSQMVGWMKVAEEGRFAWKFKKNDDGTYYIQNVLTGLYAGRPTKNEISETMLYTETPEVKQEVERLNYQGYFSIRFEGGAYVFHQEGHNSGWGENGMVVLFDGGIASASSWFLREVPADVAESIDATHNKELLESYVTFNPDLDQSYTVGTRVGQLKDEAVLKALETAYKKAVDGLYGQLDENEAATLLANLKEAHAAANANKIPLTEGYYRIKVANPDVVGSVADAEKLAWAHHATNVDVIEWGLDDGTADYIWKFIPAEEDGQFYMQNTSTKRYVKGLDEPYRVKKITSSAEALTPHIFTSIDGLGTYNIYDANYLVCNYHALDWNQREGHDGTICYAEGNPSMWYLEAVDKATVDELTGDALINNRIDTLKNIISLAQAAIDATETAMFDFTAPVVTEASQLSSNAQASADEQETSFDNLIDGNLGTIFHSRYNSPEPIDDYHHLMVYAEKGLPAQFGIRWAKRCFDANSNNNRACRPTKILIAVSKDGQIWENEQTLTTADGLPTEVTDTFYVSRKAINGEGYNYFVMKVLEVNDNFGMSDYYGHPFFTMSEYNLYPFTMMNPASPAYDPEIKASIDALQETIGKINEKIAGRTVTGSDIPEMQAAYDAFLASLKDTTEVGGLVEDIKRYIDLEPGSGEFVGDVPQSAIDKLASDFAATGLDKNNVYTLSKSQLAEMAVTLTAMSKDFLAQITKPAPGRWYVIQVAEANEERANNVLCATGYNAHSPFSDGTYSRIFGSAKIDDAGTKDREHVVFTENEDGRFIMQFVSSGAYNGPEFDESVSYERNVPILWYEPTTPLEIIPFGNGQVGFRTESGKYIRSHAEWNSNGTSYEKNPTGKYADTHYAWKFVPSDELVDDIIVPQSIAQGRVMAISKPFEIDGLPRIEYGVLQGYKIVGAVNSGDDASLTTGFKLQAYGEDEVIPAGVPVIYIADGDTYDGSVKYDATFIPKMNGNVTRETLTVNGLMATLDNYFTQEDHMGYFLNDSVVDEPINTLIGVHRAVILPAQVKEIEGAKVDCIVYVKGAGMLNGITDAIVENPAETVSVYTIDGVRIRANVKRADALNGLAKGIYIVGKQKALVK